MANYFYKWIPLFVLGTILLLGLPWLGLIALIVVVFSLFSALAALTFAVGRAIGAVSRAIARQWDGRTSPRHGMAPNLAPAPSAQRPAQLPPTGA
jgi:amino acid transporter